MINRRHLLAGLSALGSLLLGLGSSRATEVPLRKAFRRNEELEWCEIAWEEIAPNDHLLILSLKDGKLTEFTEWIALSRPTGKWGQLSIGHKNSLLPTVFGVPAERLELLPTEEVT